MTAKREVLEELKTAQSNVNWLTKAYYALMYGHADEAIAYINHATYESLEEETALRLIEAIRKEQK